MSQAAGEADYTSKACRAAMYEVKRRGVAPPDSCAAPAPPPPIPPHPAPPAPRPAPALPLSSAPLTAVARWNGEDYRKFRPTYPDSLYESVLVFAGQERHHASSSQQRGGLAVDLGCGNGQATSALAPHFDRVIGLDPSEEQLRNADRSQANVEYRLGSCGATGLPPHSVDLLTAASALHWCEWVGGRRRPPCCFACPLRSRTSSLPPCPLCSRNGPLPPRCRFDLPALWREARRILKPGGAFAAWSYSGMTVGSSGDAARQVSVLPGSLHCGRVR